MFTNRGNKQKPNQNLIRNFQATYSDIVRPSSNTCFSIGPDTSGVAAEAAQTVRMTASLNVPSIDAMPIMDAYDGTLDAMAKVVHSPAGDLFAPSSRVGALFDGTIFDKFIKNSLGARAHYTFDDIFGGQYHSQPPHILDPYLKDMSFSPKGLRVPREGDVDTITMGEVDKQNNYASASDSNNALRFSQDKFRYCVTLHAPTAMVKDQNETPITYLNKGQTYTLSIADLVPPPACTHPTKYRTSIRIVFDKSAQTVEPSSCWQLWKHARGLKDAEERGSGLQAVDCLDPAEGKMGQSRNQIQLERMSLDGFCCTWTADIYAGIRECRIGVRFNFLSTDFSRSKGVKSSSVRLCAKTESIASEVENAGVDNNSEMCCCKVKLFRDHGAERKFHSDISQAEKTIKKLQREMTISEIGEGNQFGKRKRSSISSVSRSTASHAMTDEEQQQAQLYRYAKLQKLNDSLTSNLPMTVFTQRAEPKDDPDLFPIQLPSVLQGSPKSDASLQRTGSKEVPSHINLTTPSTTIHEPSRASSSAVSGQSPSQRIFNVPLDPANSSSRSERPYSRSAACFYIRFYYDGDRQDRYHRALYLKERTVRDLTAEICRKQYMDPDSVVRVLHIKPRGLKIIVDDDVVEQLPDSQVMTVEFSRISKPYAPSADTEFEIILNF